MKPDMGVLNQDNIVEFIGSIFDRREVKNIWVSRSPWENICCRVPPLQRVKGSPK